MVFDLVTSDDDVTIPNKNTNRQTDVVKKSKYRMFLEPIFANISQNSQNWLSKFTKEFHLQPGTLSREKARMWFFFYSGKKPGCFWFLLLLLSHYEVTLCKVTWESTATRCVNNTTVPSRNNGRQLMTACNCLKIKSILWCHSGASDLVCRSNGNNSLRELTTAGVFLCSSSFFQEFCRWREAGKWYIMYP